MRHIDSVKFVFASFLLISGSACQTSTLSEEMLQTIEVEFRDYVFLPCIRAARTELTDPAAEMLARNTRAQMDYLGITQSLASLNDSERQEVYEREAEVCIAFNQELLNSRQSSSAVQPVTLIQDDFDFGDDSSSSANFDGQCDDNRFIGPDRFYMHFDHGGHNFKDATDCRGLYAAGLIRLRIREIEGNAVVGNAPRAAVYDRLEVDGVYCLPPGTPVMAQHPRSITYSNISESLRNSIRIPDVESLRIPSSIQNQLSEIQLAGLRGILESFFAVRVIEVERSRLNPWYRVSLVGDENIGGWVNSTALIQDGAILCE